MYGFSSVLMGGDLEESGWILALGCLILDVTFLAMYVRTVFRCLVGNQNNAKKRRAPQNGSDASVC